MGKIGQMSLWDWIPGRSWRIVATVEAADEIPPQLPSTGAVLVGSIKHPKWLAFDCPCKTGHRIMITLDQKHFPHWSIFNEKKLTVSPSVDYRVPGRRCHYLIRQGKVIWVKEKEVSKHGRKR
jgi:hypothetical protein